MAGKKRKKAAGSAGKESDIQALLEGLKKSDQYITLPKTLLKKEEWGLLTVLNLLLAGVFPAYFVNILLISFFTEVGHLFTTHVSEIERQKLMDFEKEFRRGYENELGNKWREAVKVYRELSKKYSENPRIAGIASKRIEWINKEKIKAKGRK